MPCVGVVICPRQPLTLSIPPSPCQAAREEAELEKQAAIKKAKEEETARLRAQQERAQDKQSEIDELRARRYQEAYEREWRDKEAAAAERQRIIQEDLLIAREAQQQAKIKQMADQAMAERAEFERILRANREKEAEESAQVRIVSGPGCKLVKRCPDAFLCVCRGC